jgi:thioredoxin-related protein
MNPNHIRPAQALSALLWLMLLSSRLISAEPVALPYATDLKQLGKQAADRDIPILLMASQHHCGFCDAMKKKVLLPMQLSGDYTHKVFIRELRIDPGEQVTNFQGQQESAKQFSHRYHVHVTPTLLFLDGYGHEVAERIIGINTVDYLPFYIEEAIETATKNSPHGNRMTNR